LALPTGFGFWCRRAARRRDEPASEGRLAPGGVRPSNPAEPVNEAREQEELQHCSTFPSRANAWTPIYLPVAVGRAVVPS
jgi:hypothetical protein